MRLIEIRVRYRRGHPWVLHDVSCVLNPGDVVAVTGRNGAGKSTLLRVLAGQLRPTRGSVEDRPEVVGWVPEQFPSGQPFTAAWYLQAMATVRGMTRQQAGPVIGDLAERLGFGRFLRTSLRELSKGTARKVGLAQALLVPPGLLVMDEPWEGLDAETQAEVPRLIAEVASGGCSVVVTDHRPAGDRSPSSPAATPATGSTNRIWRIEDGLLREVVPDGAGA